MSLYVLRYILSAAVTLAFGARESGAASRNNNSPDASVHQHGLTLAPNRIAANTLPCAIDRVCEYPPAFGEVYDRIVAMFECIQLIEEIAEVARWREGLSAVVWCMCSCFVADGG